MTNALENFSLKNKTILITGGAGLLGCKHAESVLDAGGAVCLLDISQERLETAKANLDKLYPNSEIHIFPSDITSETNLLKTKEDIINKVGTFNGLINNAANNPKVEGGGTSWSHLENFPLEMWNNDVAVGLTGAFLCSRIFGSHMAEQGKGVILNIASDLGLIGPDQRIYRNDGETKEEQMVKPVTYSVVKSGLIGLTRYLATYWAESGIRANAICPGGVYAGQDEAFVQRLTNLIPMGRMASPDEYKSAIVFLMSDASSYMTGSIISMDGGRTAW